MSYQALARKWRPQRFNELVGQEHIVRALQHALANDRLHHALLFSGTRGVGKTTIGRLVAKGLNCEQGMTAEPCGECGNCQAIERGQFVDLIEVDAASRTGVDDTRELLDNVQYAPASGRYKVYLIDEVHMLSKAAFNALLKTLEEPPEHIRFLLATTDPQKLPITVLSRCLQFHLKRLPRKEIQQRLEAILKAENFEFESGATELLARSADGSLRDGISLLDQAIAYGHGHLKTEEVADMLGSIARRDVIKLIQALAAADATGLYAAVEALDEQAPDYAAALDEIALMLQQLAVLQLLPNSMDDEPELRTELQPLSDQLSPEAVQLFYQISITGKRDLPLAPDPRSGFEMTLLRMLAFEPAQVGQVGETSSGQQSNVRQAAIKSEPKAVAQPQATASVSTAATEQPTHIEEGNHAAQMPTADATLATGGDIPPVSPENWLGIVDTLQLQGMADQLARHCAWQSFEDDVFTLALSAEQEALFSDRHKNALLTALQSRFGDSIRVKIEASEASLVTPVAMADSDERERQQQAEAALAADPQVQALGERFGATLHPGSVESLD
ncbi:MAG: DNA polymerase III subunit gamma/tau [Salinisphaeraceae bacterium]|nr:DNA polymerase III subunit gamma/tau [Salinisphaeraceae bacterium]